MGIVSLYHFAIFIGGHILDTTMINLDGHQNLVNY